ncbi:Zinc finger, PMZ-type [Corchorus olitorius]|uniref:Protein FAR1-RELATED SEQUENCE n=1 Tax=Corchorus olitorius TaxID=93759 RepID=A0A1R3GUG1_9ROSI|nr:Zinc finger, PMZ-type [Corchorus olitorius]
MAIDEFEFEWNVLLAKYGLEENGLMKYLYMPREKWVPAFLRTTFCAGMSTTQRSESMNKFFKDYVRPSTLVSDFVHQYDKALNARYQKEKEKDVKTKSSKAILKTCYKMEDDAAKHYTRKMFSKFQDELFSSQNYKASKDRDEREKKIYKVIPHGKERPIHEVSLDISDNKTICTCHKFEFVGILCRHILAVFVKKSLVNSLPKCFILERWTIDAKRHTVPDIAWIHEEILAISVENEENLEASVPTSNFEATNLDESNIVMTLQDPLHVRSRGRPKSLRAKNLKENQSRPSGIKRKCTMCKAEGHKKITCPSLKPSLIAGILLSSDVGVKQNSSSVSILHLSSATKYPQLVAVYGPNAYDSSYPSSSGKLLISSTVPLLVLRPSVTDPGAFAGSRTLL